MKPTGFLVVQRQAAITKPRNKVVASSSYWNVPRKSYGLSKIEHRAGKYFVTLRAKRLPLKLLVNTNRCG